MNKKGQAIVIISILVLILAFAFVTYFFFVGSGFNDISNENTENYQQQENGDIPKQLPKSAIIPPPFFIDSWITKESAFSFKIVNGGSEKYTIKSLSAEGCGTLEKEIVMAPRFSHLFEIECEYHLRIGEAIRSNIELIYFKQDSSLQLKSTGVVNDVIIN